MRFTGTARRARGWKWKRTISSREDPVSPTATAGGWDISMARPDAPCDKRLGHRALVWASPGAITNRLQLLPQGNTASPEEIDQFRQGRAMLLRHPLVCISFFRNRNRYRNRFFY
jgi:hypothetical protein